MTPMVMARVGRANGSLRRQQSARTECQLAAEGQSGRNPDLLILFSIAYGDRVGCGANRRLHERSGFRLPKRGDQAA